MKNVDSSEIIAACDLKLIDLMKIFEYWRSMFFLYLRPMSFTFKFNLVFSETSGPF